MEEGLRFAAFAVLLSAWLYFLSRIQMKAWLKEVDKFFGDKFENYSNKFKNQKDDKNESKN